MFWKLIREKNVNTLENVSFYSKTNEANMFKSETFLPNSSSEHFLNWTKFKTKINYHGLQSREIGNGSMFFCIMYSVMFFFGLFTNLLVVFVFLFKKELRQYTNYFFTNLSVADLLVIIVCIPVAISDLLSPDVWNFGLVYCKLYYFIEHCVTTVSSLTIIFISLERYFAISRPLSYSNIEAFSSLKL
ncbi:growth hormone secretagogue receptor type 1-like [Brachionus plicatilis]|uniref:Growth hormone secretagogue receptor type 1-like n=1 Tax=Brachionus plicatilis TaxID=10195 RepID=A0A3M7QRE9_BRAPC|nr:growth hormone secretagogue receptor type 1-like [Brachionus plicatilis]